MKKLIFMMAVAVAAGAAFADGGTDVLMWYLDLSDSSDSGTADSTVFDTLNFYMVDPDDMTRASQVNLNSRTYTDAGSLQSGTDAGINTGNDVYQAGVYYTDLRGIDNLSTYEFMMTMYNDGNLVAWTKWLYNDHLESTEHVTLATLQSQAESTGNPAGLYSLGQLTTDQSVSSLAGAHNFGQNVVPEPTSGLLMLVGGALLALRRKRRAA